MWSRIVMEEHYTGCQHSVPFVANGPTHFFSVLQYKMWLSPQAADFFDTGAQKHIPRYD
jgi:hypothetical protein